MRATLLFGGLFILIFVMIRLMFRNNNIRRTQKKDVKSIEEKLVELRMKTEANDFGQKLKWAVDTDNGKENRPSGGAEPPTGRSR